MHLVTDVVSSLKEAFELGSFLIDLDKFFELVLNVNGTEEAFVWLARAHRKKNGWNRYWTNNNELSVRLTAVDSHYSSFWFEFIHESFRKFHGAPWSGLMIGHSSWVRLVEFCFRMRQTELAVEIARQMINSTKELCSSQTFPRPE